MSVYLLFALDIVAIAVLTFALYFPRHKRRDMVVAYLAINVGVLGVTYAMATASIGVGVGLGLFGVLSIIRLRSTEMDQHEVAYYFAALTLGLLGGFHATSPVVNASWMALIVAVMFIADHPRVMSRYRRQNVTLDRAITDESALRATLEHVLGGTVHVWVVRKVDFVSDTTQVDVRYTPNHHAVVGASDAHELTGSGMR